MDADRIFVYPLDGGSDDVLAIRKSDLLSLLADTVRHSNVGHKVLLSVSVFELDAVEVSVLVKAETNARELDLGVDGILLHGLGLR